VDRIKLGQLPLLAKIAIAITFYNAFVLLRSLSSIGKAGTATFPGTSIINSVPGTSLQSL